MSSVERKFPSAISAKRGKIVDDVRVSGLQAVARVSLRSNLKIQRHFRFSTTRTSKDSFHTKMYKAFVRKRSNYWETKQESAVPSSPSANVRHRLIFLAYLKDPRLYIVECLPENVSHTKTLKEEIPHKFCKAA